MDIWNRLGIKQTTSKSKIKQAYSAMLKEYHPEDNPEGFMMLRKAYEEAIKQSDYENNQVNEGVNTNDNNTKKEEEPSTPKYSLQDGTVDPNNEQKKYFLQNETFNPFEEKLKLIVRHVQEQSQKDKTIDSEVDYLTDSPEDEAVSSQENEGEDFLKDEIKYFPEDEPADSAKGKKINTPEDEPADSAKGKKINTPEDEPADSAKGKKINTPEDEPADSAKGKKINSPEDELTDSATGKKINSPEEKKADSPQNETDENSPIKSMHCFKKVNELYKDVFKRNDIKQWQKLFLDFTLAESQDLYKHSHNFFNANCHLPHGIWKYLDSEFSLCRNQDFRWSIFINYDFGLNFDFLDKKKKCNYEKYAQFRFSAFYALYRMDYKLSIKESLEAEKIFDDDPVLYRILGISYYMSQSYNHAIEVITKALFRRFEPELLIYRGNAFLMKQDYTNAKADFDAVLKIDGDNAECIKGLTICNYYTKKLHTANKLRNFLYKSNLHDVELDLLLFKHPLESSLTESSQQQRFDNYIPEEKTPIKEYLVYFIIIFILVPLLFTVAYLIFATPISESLHLIGIITSLVVGISIGLMMLVKKEGE